MVTQVKTMINIKEEIAAIKERFPFKYNSKKYKSPQQEFRIILNELHELGTTAIVVPVFQHKEGMRRIYRYTAQINYINVKSYASSHSAKLRITREYLKLKKENNGS